MMQKNAVAAPTGRGRRTISDVRIRGHKLPLRPRGSSAFTLIELLVVIGLIVALVAGFGISLSDRGGRSLITAQQSVAALCGSARAQAALHQTEARVLVHADPASDEAANKYLRLLQVFRAEPAGSETWVAAGAPLYLPRGVYVVPTDPAGLIADGADWPQNPRLGSNLSAGPCPPVAAGTEFAKTSSVLFVQFSPDGGATLAGSTSSPRVVLATAKRSDRLQFDNPHAIRGIVIRASGVIAFVHDASGF